MKASRLILALAALALPAIAETPQPRAPGIESPAYLWNAADAELLQALAHRGDPVRGKDAYTLCRGCHKPDGAGRPDAGYPQLAGQHATVLLKQMTDVRAGRRDNPRMHPFIEAETLAAADLADIAAYLSGLPVPANNRQGDGARLESGRRLYEDDCAACHGLAGEGDAAKTYPRVAGQHYPYLYRATLDIRDQTRRNANPRMVKVLKRYADEDVAAVSDYMSRLPTGK